MVCQEMIVNTMGPGYLFVITVHICVNMHHYTCIAMCALHYVHITYWNLILQNIDFLQLSRELVKLHNNVIVCDFKDLYLTEINSKELKKFAEKYEFESFETQQYSNYNRKKKLLKEFERR